MSDVQTTVLKRVSRWLPMYLKTSQPELSATAESPSPIPVVGPRSTLTRESYGYGPDPTGVGTRCLDPNNLADKP